jgi:hypothetical protein
LHRRTDIANIVLACVAMRALRSLILLSPPSPYDSPAISIRTPRRRLPKSDRFGRAERSHLPPQVGYPRLPLDPGGVLHVALPMTNALRNTCVILHNMVVEIRRDSCASELYSLTETLEVRTVVDGVQFSWLSDLSHGDDGTVRVRGRMQWRSDRRLWRTTQHTICSKAT